VEKVAVWITVAKTTIDFHGHPNDQKADHELFEHDPDTKQDDDE
jgi:hypothetical protein